MSKRNRVQHPSFLPQGLLRFFAVVAVLLVPWALYVSQTLPSDHLSRQWNQAWTGFDLGLIIALGLTAYFGLRRSWWVIISASSAGTLLLVDAWFDCLTAKQGGEYLLSISTALCIEIPIAIMAFWIAYSAGKHYSQNK